MKSFIFGALSLLTLNIINEYVWYNTIEDTKNPSVVNKVSKYLKFNVFEGGYILNVIEGNCKDEMGVNGHGWSFNTADYFGCDKFQRLLNGNHKPLNPNGPKY
jgi:hypothetical protein